MRKITGKLAFLPSTVLWTSRMYSSNRSAEALTNEEAADLMARLVVCVR